MHALIPDPDVTRVERANQLDFKLTLADTASERTFDLSVRLHPAPPFLIDEISLRANE